MSVRLRAQRIRSALEFGERPDPARGIFETLLVLDGHAQMRERHLARLRASAHELYGAEPALDERCGERPRVRWNGRLRLRLVPGEGVSRQRGELGPDPVYTELAPFVLAGGLGRHKWLDRTLLDALTAVAGRRALPLILDEDLTVLEASWASVLIEERGRLIGHPDDGRALPGIGRARLSYDEEPVSLDRLLACDAVVLASALRIVRLANR